MGTADLQYNELDARCMDKTVNPFCVANAASNKNSKTNMLIHVTLNFICSASLAMHIWMPRYEVRIQMFLSHGYKVLNLQYECIR